MTLRNNKHTQKRFECVMTKRIGRQKRGKTEWKPNLCVPSSLNYSLSRNHPIMNIVIVLLWWLLFSCNILYKKFINVNLNEQVTYYWFVSLNNNKKMWIVILFWKYVQMYIYWWITFLVLLFFLSQYTLPGMHYTCVFTRYFRNTWTILTIQWL